MTATLDIHALAAELGRSPTWLYHHWQRLVREERMPRPLQATPPLAWSRAQIYAWLDRGLTAEQRVAAAGYRAAIEAVRSVRRDTSAAASDIAAHTERLNRRFVQEPS